MHQSRNTLRQAVIKLLEEFGPTHYRKLAEEILSKGLAVSSSKKPEMALNSTLSADITRNGSKSEFIRLSPGVYGLRALHAAGPESESKVLGVSPNPSREDKNGVPDNSRRVCIPYFPTYGEVRHLLKVWPGCIEAHVTGLHSTLVQLRGTPQNPVTWTDPETWIPEKLSGEIRDLAMAIWVESGQDVNPRYTYGNWRLVRIYDLLRVDSDGKLRLTDQGRDFIEHQGGRTEIFLDQQEGLAELLAMISGSGSVRFGDLVDEWSEYLEQYSRFRTDSTIRDTLRRRLNNLLDRGLIDRERTNYSVTDTGIAYLKRAVTSSKPDERQQIRKLAKAHKEKVRASLREHLLQMHPDDFEDLVAHLLDKMNYQNVKVVGQSGDGGVDVIAEIELGITSVREVVQAKRHRGTVQRKDLDALRGSLYRFNAVRGTIVATSSFAKGAKEAAFAQGAAPITLIDGDRLVDLLIEHGIGIRKHPIEVLSIDLDGLSQVENSVEE